MTSRFPHGRSKYVPLGESSVFLIILTNIKFVINIYLQMYIQLFTHQRPPHSYYYSGSSGGSSEDSSESSEDDGSRCLQSL